MLQNSYTYTVMLSYPWHISNFSNIKTTFSCPLSPLSAWRINSESGWLSPGRSKCLGLGSIRRGKWCAFIPKVGKLNDYCVFVACGSSLSGASPGPKTDKLVLSSEYIPLHFLWQISVCLSFSILQLERTSVSLESLLCFSDYSMH